MTIPTDRHAPQERQVDPVTLNQWYPISAVAEVPAERVTQTLLLDEAISYTSLPGTGMIAWRSTGLANGARVTSADIQEPLPCQEALGYLWTTLGDCPADLFDLEWYHDPQRRNVNAGSPMVAASAPRSVENFLDLAHLPHVHSGLLGELPHTEVVDYDVEFRDGEIWALNCDCWVPQFSPTDTGGRTVRYSYRVPHISCALLWCPSAPDPSRPDIYGLFVQPMTQERCRAHNYVGVIDHESSDNDIKHFQLLIFGQDKPILENQFPKRLPLDPRAETPIRADKYAIAYRRWLRELGVTYGVVPAPGTDR